MSNFKSLLVYPPAADFTQPHSAIPYLAAHLRDKGEHVVVKDLNIEAFHYIIGEKFLKKCEKKVKKRFASLNKKEAVNLNEQREYIDVMEALGVNRGVVSGIGKIKKGFRNQTFFKYKEYKKNVDFLNQALKLVSCAHFPTKLEGAEYSTPFFLNSDEDIKEQTERAFNPYIEYYEETFLPFLEKEKPDLIGLSVTYSSQALQMFALAHLIRKRLPGIHICAGGAFLSRVVLNMKREKFKTLFEYLDSAIVYEGETALYNLVSYLKEKNPGKPFSTRNVLLYNREKDAVTLPPGDVRVEDPDQTPPPDYDGFPLELYLSPKPILPYAPTRGCYWNKCAFCHYGATKERTAGYREGSVQKIMDDLEFLADRYHVDHFAFSVDIMSPTLARGIADEMIKRNLPYRWNTDIRFEESFTDELCIRLKEGGCEAVAVGLESGSGRILQLIQKGINTRTAERVIRNFSDAGICVQVMTFLNFPTETAEEAVETIHFISRNTESISLFTMGDYELLYGSKVFQNPEKYGIKRVFFPKGDDFKILCLYEEYKKNKTEMDTYTVDSAYLRIAEKYNENENPYAGAVSTCHTFLYFKKFGKDVFKQFHEVDAPGKKRSNRKFNNLSKPRLHPDVRIIRGNFSIQEANENLEANAARLQEKMFEGGATARQALNEIVDEKKIFAGGAQYIRIQDMKWMEMPHHVKEILDLCNGKNNYKRIVKSKGKDFREVIRKMLNELLAINVLK